MEGFCCCGIATPPLLLEPRRSLGWSGSTHLWRSVWELALVSCPSQHSSMRGPWLNVSFKVPCILEIGIFVLETLRFISNVHMRTPAALWLVPASARSPVVQLLPKLVRRMILKASYSTGLTTVLNRVAVQNRCFDESSAKYIDPLGWHVMY